MRRKSGDRPDARHGAFPAAQGEPESFLAIWVSVKGLVHSLRKLNLAAFMQHYVYENRSAGPVQRARFSFFCVHAQTSSPSSPGSRASADYFRGRSFTNEIILLRRTCLAFAFAAISAVAESGNIQGTVTDPLGAVVPDAQVQLFREGKLVGSATTDSEGKYRFAPLAADVTG